MQYKTLTSDVGCRYLEKEVGNRQRVDNGIAALLSQLLHSANQSGVQC